MAKINFEIHFITISLYANQKCIFRFLFVFWTILKIERMIILKNQIVKDQMTTPAITADWHTPIREVIRTMKSADIGFLPIVKNELLVGVVTDRDILLRAVLENKLDDPVEGIMTREDLSTVRPSTPLQEAAEMMAFNLIRRLVVTEDGKVVGVLTSKNLLDDRRFFAYIAQTYQRPSVNPTYGLFKNSNPHDSVEVDDFPL